MGRRGRPPKGLGNIDSLDGNEEAKVILRTLLATLTGDASVEEAVEHLGVGRTKLFEARSRALQGALATVLPGRRQHGEPSDEDANARVAALEAKLDEMQAELEAARIRLEIALVMPHLLHPPGQEKKRRGRPRRAGHRVTAEGSKTS